VEEAIATYQVLLDDELRTLGPDHRLTQTTS